MIVQHVGQVGFIPQRIVSLVPSQTELLAYLDLEKETAGITKFCIYPPGWQTSKQVIGGTKNVNIGLVRSMQPDLIIANKEENVKEQVEELAKDHTVWVTDINNLDQALQMILDIGLITGKPGKAEQLVSDITLRFNSIPSLLTPVRTAYLVWKEPLMAVGGHTFINDLLQRCGFHNVFEATSRYPVINMEELLLNECQLLLLSSEPYPFNEKHIREFETLLPGTRILLADGEFFGWYGSRLLQAPAYFEELLAKI